MKLVVGKPIPVNIGPTLEEADWGPWQFPQLRRAENGDIFAAINVGLDNWEDVESGSKWFVSHDEGQTWSDSCEIDAFRALPAAPNGDRLEASQGTYFEVDPKIFDAHEPVYVLDFEDKPFFDYYKYEDLAEHFDKRVVFKRLKNGANEIEVFKPDVTDNPGLCVVRPSGRNLLLTNKLYGRLRRAPDGSLWQMHYDRGIVNGEFCDVFLAYYYRSTDNGKTWSLVSTLDPRETEGAICYCEQDIEWFGDNKAITTIRAAGTWVAISDDGGFTWNKPFKIDDIGVDPPVHALPCGALLTSYGRPGFVIRACFDGLGEKWEEPVEIIPRTDNSWKLNDKSMAGSASQYGTCSYSDIITLSDNEALVAYTDFFYPDKDGVKRKTLMVVKVSVTE